MTLSGLGSSGEDPWGSLLGGLGVGLHSQEPALSAWEAVMFPWEAWRALCLAECLGICLLDLLTWLPAWLEGGCYLLGMGFPQQRYMWWPCCLLGRKHCHQGRGKLPELLMSCFLPLREDDHLPEKLGILLNCFLPQGWRWASAREAACLPDLVAWDATKLLPSPRGRWGPVWARLLSFPRGRRAPVWEWTALEANRLLPSLEGRWVPVLEANRLLPSLGGKVSTCLPACLGSH